MPLSEISYDIFLKRLDDSAKDRLIPLRVLFELTYRCNFYCNYCYLKSEALSLKRKELSTAEVFEVLRQLKELGCFHLGFSGGEVFLRKDFFDIARTARNNGFNISILTNGSLIDAKTAREIKKLSPNKVDITLHYMNEEKFEKVTKVKGSFKKVMRSIKLLKEQGIQLGIKNCFLGQTVSEMEEVEGFSRSIGAITRLGAQVLPRVDLNNLLKSARPKSGQANEKKGVFGACNVGRTSLTIDPFGRVKLCPQTIEPGFDISKYGLSACFKKLKRFRQRLESIECTGKNGCIASLKSKLL